MSNTLVVDLDGTLLRTDLLHESVFALARVDPLDLFRLPFWLARGKAHMKQRIAERVSIRPDLLPWNEEFLEDLKAEHEAGRRIVLATASHERYARAIADHLGIFDAVLCTTPEVNMSGAQKLRHIEELLGGESFTYAGNAHIDVPIWEKAEEAVLVNPSPGVRQRADAVARVGKVYGDRKPVWRAFLKAMRPHQWLKNVLVFVPLVLAHRIDSIEYDLNVILAFLAFSLCASSVYLLNDLLDLEADRQHPTKRRRPFAAGDLPIVYGVVGMGALLLAALLLAMLLPPYFLLVLGLYYLLTLAYSIWLKRAAIVDGITLAALYTLRLIAGASAIEVQPSFWLLAFSMFIFLSLAFIKRYSELLLLHNTGRSKLTGRGYTAVDMETLAVLGTASGYLAVLVLALYINGDTVNELYARPEALWLLCPILLYWVSRMWLLTRRGEMHDDPVVFTVTDRRTWLLAVFAGISLLVAVYWPIIRPWLPLPG